MIRSRLLLETLLALVLVASIRSHVGAGEPAGNEASLHQQRPASIVALMYHRFVSQAEYARLTGRDRIYSISTEAFEAQLADLHHRGILSLSLDAALDVAKGRFVPDGPAVLITIDDGNRCALTVAGPLLRKYGMRATLFITTDPEAFVFDLSRPNHRRLSNQEISTLDLSVFDVGAHGHSHRPLKSLPDDELLRELRKSRSELERLTGKPVHTMAVPGNWYDERVLQFARRVGYEAVFTSDKGVISQGSELLRLPRMTVQGYKSLRGFQQLFARAQGDTSLRGNVLSLPR